MPLEILKMIELAILVIFPVAVIYAALMDMVSMTISNKISLILIASFFILAAAIGMDLEKIGWHVALAMIVLVVGFGFFAAGWVGGGDVKLASSIVMWLGWEYSMGFLAVAGILGGLLTVVLLLGRKFALPISLQKIDWVVRLHKLEDGIPYGVALAPASLFVFSETPWMKYVYENADWMV